MIKQTISRLFIAIITTMVLLVSCKTETVENWQGYQIDKVIKSDKAAVVSAHPEASRIGLEILKSGGNAIDAAIAVQFALAVCYPNAGNIGGGGFAVIRNANGGYRSLDFREMAPKGAFPDMYLDSERKVIDSLSTYGHLAAGIPGSVDGMTQLYENGSKLKNWKALVEPAVLLAKEGFHLTKMQADQLNEYKNDFKKHNTVANAFTTDEVWHEGDLFVQADLANTLMAIRDEGRNGFYAGDVATKIVAEMKRGNGIITEEDLRDYRSVWRDVISTDYRGYKIASMAPPSSGGIILLQILEILEHTDLDQYAFHSPEAIHLIVEAERRAYADRAKHLGDSDFYPVPQAFLLDSIYIASRAATINKEMASKSETIQAGIPNESEQTTHFCIVDEEGNAVSLTTTINTSYGSKTIVGGAGFILNNEMDDFSSKPGVPNYYGLVGSEANKIEPGKRMLSSMTPTIVEKDGKLSMVVGTPGGSTIITSVLQTILNKIVFDLPLKEAVHSPRFHHQWLPDSLYVEENSFSLELLNQLKAKGHAPASREAIGRVEAIWVGEDGKLESVADTRGDDAAVGY